MREPNNMDLTEFHLLDLLGRLNPTSVVVTPDPSYDTMTPREQPALCGRLMTLGPFRHAGASDMSSLEKTPTLILLCSFLPCLCQGHRGEPSPCPSTIALTMEVMF